MFGGSGPARVGLGAVPGGGTEAGPGRAINGPDPDAPEGYYLAALRPYGVLGMAWAIWREVPGAEPKEALSLARRVRVKGEAEVLVATRFLAEHVQAGLRARHLLVARLDPVDRQRWRK